MTTSPLSPHTDPIDTARAWATLGQEEGSLTAWVQCASAAYRVIASDDRNRADAAIELATHAADEAIALVLRQHPSDWSAGPLRVGGVSLQLELRGVSPTLRPPLRVRRARDVSMEAFDGKRYGRPGFGVPLATLSSRDASSPNDRLSPHSGAFQNLTAWIEPDVQAPDAPARLVLADPYRLDAVTIGSHRLTLASDTSAAYAWGMQVSNLERVGLWGLVGGKEVGRRAGLYLLEDYDPAKCPLVMIHGLGSNPLIWSHVSNAVWGAPDLRERFQIWQIVHPSDAPLLAARLHAQDYLDEAWRLLDPGGDAKARSNAVLIGHSLGGVISRLLCADSGDVLWNAAFLVSPDALDADEADVQLIRRIFFFGPYPGVSRAVFLAAPHHGSPSAATMLGRLTGDVVGSRTGEVQALRRIALRNPHAVRPEVLQAFQQGWLNSITTLQSQQPVRRAAQSLMPPAGFAFHTIAGVHPGRRGTSDGVVPLDSAMLPGAASMLVVESGHRVHEHPAVAVEIVRILREHAQTVGLTAR